MIFISHVNIYMRIHYLDNIRSTTVILVVFYHVFFIFNSVIPELSVGCFNKLQYQDIILYILHPWIMIILFITAGISSRLYLSNHTIKEFVIARTHKLLVPSTIGLFVFGWAQGLVNMTIYDAFKTIQSVPFIAKFLIIVLSGTSVLWFNQMLWLFSMILALIRKYENGHIYRLSVNFDIIAMVLLVIPVYISGLVLNTPVVTVYRFGVYGFTFFLGYFVFAHDEVITKISRFSYILIVSSIMLGAVYVKLHFGENYANMPYVGCPSNVAFAWITILAIFASMKIIGNKSTKVFEFIKDKSYGIYMFHYLPISYGAFVLKKYTTLPSFACYFILAFSSIIFSVCIFEIFRRIPVLRWCLLGIE